MGPGSPPPNQWDRGDGQLTEAQPLPQAVGEGTTPPRQVNRSQRQRRLRQAPPPAASRGVRGTTHSLHRELTPSGGGRTADPDDEIYPWPAQQDGGDGAPARAGPPGPAYSGPAPGHLRQDARDMNVLLGKSPGAGSNGSPGGESQMPPRAVSPG